jgi:ribonuclease D
MKMGNVTLFERKPGYKVIETQTQLTQFYNRNRNTKWLAFDTEFIPEKYFKSKLCVISVATAHGNYVLDALKLEKMDEFLFMIEDPRILKITHAGENDYHLLVTDYNVKPANLFDTQLAYGFLNRDYPLGLQFLVERELKIRMNKEALTSDWEKRPLTPEQLEYAVHDVLHLYPLMKVLKRKLKKKGKLEWADEENKQWEKPHFFSGDSDDLTDFLNGLSTRGLNRQQKIFLLRLHRWRYEEARKRNCPLSQVLKTWLLNTIVRGIKAGKPSLIKDRTIPNRIVNQHWKTFERLYSKKINSQERLLLERLPREENGAPYQTIAVDILYQVIKLKAIEHRISPNFVLSRKELNKIKTDRGYCPRLLDEGWRKKLLGSDLIQWIKKRNPIDITIKGDTCTLTMRDRKGLSAVFLTPPGKTRVKRVIKNSPFRWLLNKFRKN